MNINGEVREGSVEIDSDNNLERFKTGSGAGEAVEIHDFQIVSEFRPRSLLPGFSSTERFLLCARGKINK